MSTDKTSRPKARLPRGFRDRTAAEIAAERRMLETIRQVYESYGFEPLETPAFEYTDALGKFLPDLDRPNEGVFSLKDDDGQWLSLRYDLTAPLARYVAQNFQELPKPFRRYQVGQVWRNEKPGPGRYREFTQFDADTVGSASPAADAELLMMVADTFDALCLEPGDVAIKVNSRLLLDGVLEAAGIGGDQVKRGVVLRAIDKLDRLGIDGVRELLGKGRKDESGDFTKGAELVPSAADRILSVLAGKPSGDSAAGISAASDVVRGSASGEAGIAEVSAILKILNRARPDRVVFDPGIVRGLDYYTGAVFEAQLTYPTENEEGMTVVLGSVAGGGRYDDLVARFTGQKVPATGISLGVSRLLSAVKEVELRRTTIRPLVVVLVTENDQVGESFAMAGALRANGIRAEAYVGTKKFGDQLKYADKRGAALAVIEGADERAAGKVTLKDLKRGAELSKSIESRAEWLGERQAQVTVERSELVAKVREMLARDR